MKVRIPAVLTALLAALVLAACGDDSTSTSPQITTAQGEEEGTTKSTDREREPKQGKPSAGSGNEPGSGSSDPSGSANVVPLQVSGGGSAQFRIRGGDNSIQEYGQEGDESELREAADTVHAFYVAQVGEEWARACSYLARSRVVSLEQLASQSPQLKGRGCGPVLDALIEPLSASEKGEVTTVDAGSLRYEGEQAFLIYYGANRTVYAMSLEREGGAWKVTSTSPTALQQ